MLLTLNAASGLGLGQHATYADMDYFWSHVARDVGRDGMLAALPAVKLK